MLVTELTMTMEWDLHRKCWEHCLQICLFFLSFSLRKERGKKAEGKVSFLVSLAPCLSNQTRPA